MENKGMIKIYGMNTCPDCTYLYDQINGRENESTQAELSIGAACGRDGKGC